MIVFKIIKDAYVLKYIEGNPAPAQQLKIALSRTVLPALTTGNPGPVGHTLSALSIGIATSVCSAPKGQQVLKYASCLQEKNKLTKRRKKIYSRTLCC